MRLLAAEWHASLRGYPADRLHAALDEHLRWSSYWPTIAHLMEILREQTPAPGLPRLPTEAREFCRGGRNEVEEMAFRAAQVLRWKQEYGFGKLNDPLDTRRDVFKPSQDPRISDALRNTAIAKRIKTRGEKNDK